MQIKNNKFSAQRRTLVNAAWAAPAVLAVAIPAHAQATQPALCSPAVSSSDEKSFESKGPSSGSRTFRMDHYAEPGDLASMTLDYSFDVSTVFTVANNSSAPRTETLTSAYTVTLALTDGTSLGSFTPSQDITVAAAAGETVVTDAVTNNLSGTIDLLALNPNLDLFVRKLNPRVRIIFEVIKGSTRFDGTVTGGYDVRAPTFFVGRTTINYCGA